MDHGSTQIFQVHVCGIEPELMHFEPTKRLLNSFSNFYLPLSTPVSLLKRLISRWTFGAIWPDQLVRFPYECMKHFFSCFLHPCTHINTVTLNLHCQKLLHPIEDSTELMDSDEGGFEMTLELYRLSSKRIHLFIKV